MMLRLKERVGLTPRFGIIIVLALIATQVLQEVVMVELIPPPKIGLFTRDWMAERTAEAVRIATVTAPRASRGSLEKSQYGMAGVFAAGQGRHG